MQIFVLVAPADIEVTVTCTGTIPSGTLIFHMPWWKGEQTLLHNSFQTSSLGALRAPCAPRLSILRRPMRFYHGSLAATVNRGKRV